MKLAGRTMEELRPGLIAVSLEATTQDFVLGSGESAPPNIGIAVNLVAGAPQAGHAIAVYVALPRQELIV